RGGIQEPGFVKAFFYQRQREPSAVNGNIQIAKNVRQRADVVFVAVGEHDGADVRTVLLQVGNIRNHQVDAEEFRFREHHARVEDDDVLTETQHHHVHAKFAETAERN